MTSTFRAAAITTPSSPRHRYGAQNVIVRELTGIPGLSWTTYSPESLMHELERVPASAFDFAVVDMHALDNDPTALPASFRSKPNIFLVHESDADTVQPAGAGSAPVAPRNVLQRPFKAGDLRAIAQLVMNDLPPVKIPARGLHFDRARLNAYYNGQPLALLSVDLDVLRFLHQNRDATPENILHRLRQQVQGVGDLTTAPQVLQTFGRRAGRVLEQASGGRYTIEFQNDENGAFKFCRLVRRPAAKAPRITQP